MCDSKNNYCWPPCHVAGSYAFPPNTWSSGFLCCSCTSLLHIFHSFIMLYSGITQCTWFTRWLGGAVCFSEFNSRHRSSGSHCYWPLVCLQTSVSVLWHLTTSPRGISTALPQPSLSPDAAACPLGGKIAQGEDRFPAGLSFKHPLHSSRWEISCPPAQSPSSLLHRQLLLNVAIYISELPVSKIQIQMVIL